MLDWSKLLTWYKIGPLETFDKISAISTVEYKIMLVSVKIYNRKNQPKNFCKKRFLNIEGILAKLENYIAAY
jgi:hypothetical protein